MSAQLLTTDELANRLDLRPSTVASWGREGKLPRLVISRSVVRYVWSDVLRSLRNGAEARQGAGEAGNRTAINSGTGDAE